MSIERYSGLATRILREPARLGSVRVVAVDGPAGSGKTTFAARLGSALRETGAEVAQVHTDDLLEGWTDLMGFWPRLLEWIIEPLGRGEAGSYRVYDWQEERFGREWHPVLVPDVLLVEGVTSARAAASPYLNLAVLMDAPRELRLARGLERDGEQVREKWLRWMADEDRHFAADDVATRADLVVDGAPSLPHSPDVEFVGLPSRQPGGTIRG